MRAAQLLFTLGGKHDVDREFAFDGDDGLQGVKPSPIGPLAIDGSAVDDYLAKGRHGDNVGFEGWRRPCFSAHWLHIVHAVVDDSLLRPGVVVGPHAWMTFRWHQLGLLTP